MPRSIDEAAQRKRRKDAWHSTIISTIILLVSGIVVLVLRWYYQVEGFWGAVLLIYSVLELGMLAPVWILLKTRLKEIEGGEEDAATQY